MNYDAEEEQEALEKVIPRASLLSLRVGSSPGSLSLLQMYPDVNIVVA